MFDTAAPRRRQQEIRVHISVLSIEESQLSEAFGEAYRSYSREVKRLVPFIY